MLGVLTMRSRALFGIWLVVGGCGGRALSIGPPPDAAAGGDGAGRGATDLPGNLPPVAKLAATPAVVKVGDPVAFDASRSVDPDGRIVSYAFDFGDGAPVTTSSIAAASHAYARAGSFDVVLTVTDDGGAQGTDRQRVTVAKCLADADCPSGHVCASAVCACPAGLADCGACVDPQTSDQNCGGCGQVCAPGQACAAGRCVHVECTRDIDCPVGRTCAGFTCVCAPGWSLCGADCVDLQSDNQHCGRCQDNCGHTSICVNGACTCRAGLDVCFNECIDLDADPWDCGACGNVCYQSEPCIHGTCVYPMSCLEDRDCGLHETCVKGACGCPAPFQICGAGCVDAQSDARNCGRCGTTCPEGTACGAGSCAPTARCNTSADCAPDRHCTSGRCVCNDPSLTDCGGMACADLANDPGDCGACGNACGDPRRCAQGKCAKKRGDVLETLPAPVPGDPVIGLDINTSFNFWANLKSGRTIKFDVQYGTVYRDLPNPDPSDLTRPFGLAVLGRTLYFGTYERSSAAGPAGPEALGFYVFPGMPGGPPSGGVDPGIGGACAVTANDKLYVLRNDKKQIDVRDALSLAEIRSLPVTGLAAGEVVTDIALAGADLWAVGLRTPGGAPSGGFVAIIDPATGAVTAGLPPPDPAWAGGVAYDNHSIWIAGKDSIYRVEP